MTNEEKKSSSKASRKAERLEPKTVYEVIQREGQKELNRPPASLWWSGLTAGIAISLSVVAQGILHAELEPGTLRSLLEDLGYSLGFVIVILGRMQLFTENTITPVLPIMANFSGAAMKAIAVLWGTVFAANLSGTFIAAAYAEFVGFAQPEHLEAMIAVSRDAVLSKDPLEVGVLAIPAGFVIAALVWMLPSSKGFELWVILIMTYLIALGGYAHVVVGSTEVFLLLLAGEISLLSGVGGYLLPALLGNVIGGTALFSMLAYAQVREEI